MALEIDISLFGFGDDRPACFQGRNERTLMLDEKASIHRAMSSAGFSDTTGLVVMMNDRVVPEPLWDSTELHAEDKLKVLSAFEGG